MDDQVTKAAYATLKGVNKSTVTRWAATGRIVLDESGKVKIAESEARLVETADPTKEGVVARHESERGHKVGTPSGAAAPAPRDPERDSSYTKRIGESARREAAMADIAEMERDAKLGRLVDRERVERAVMDNVVASRQVLERIPDRLMLQLAAETDPEKIHALLSKEIEAACLQIADFVRQLPDALAGPKQ